MINIKNHNLQRETETLTFSWDILFTIFDNAIIIKANNYSEMHFRNGFVRCQDVQSPDYDRILAHTYYELNIKKFRPDRENMKFKEDLDKKNDVNKSGFMSKKSGTISENRKKDIKNKSMTTCIETIKYFNRNNENNANNNNYMRKPNVKDLIPVKITINLSNDYYLVIHIILEIDMKIEILQLSRKKKPSHRDANNNEKKD